METSKNKKFSIPRVTITVLLVWWSAMGKRAFDIFVSALGMLFLLPFFLFIAILIKRE